MDQKISQPSYQAIYAIFDRVALCVVGGLHLFKHDAAAVRFFSDVANLANSQISLHPQDFCLLRLGAIDEITAAILEESPPFTVLDGAAWAAAQPKQQGDNVPN